MESGWKVDGNPMEGGWERLWKVDGKPVEGGWKAYGSYGKPTLALLLLSA